MKYTLLFIICLLTSHAQANIIFVDQVASGNNDGTSWNDAFVNLQDALTAATVGDDIWVAQGTYFPSMDDDESDSFVMAAGVGIYGGFNGTETELSQRDWTVFTTRLSGEIGNANQADNSTWVVEASSSGSNCRLDGFTILGGHNWESYSYGAGIKITNSSPTIANCTFTANASDYGGAAIGINGGLLTIEKCEFIDNTSDRGACLFIQTGSVYITDCVFKENTATQIAACIYANDGLARIDRCVFTNNYSQVQVSVMNFGDNGQLLMYNSLIAGNYSVDGRAIDMSTLDNSQEQEIINCTIVNNGSQADYFTIIVTNYTTIANSIVWGNSAGSTGSQIINLTTNVFNSLVQNGLTYNGNPVSGAYNNDPEFVNPGNLGAAPFDAADFDYRVTLFSPAVNEGSNSYAADAGDNDLLLNDRIQGTSIDIGADEFNNCSLPITISANGPTTFCPGGSVELTATGAENFEWQSNSSSSASITVFNSGIYEVIGITGDSCIGLAEIQVVELIAAVNITGNDTYCPGNFTTLTATGNNVAYDWSDGQTGNSAIVGQEGWIAVTAEAANGCIVQDSIQVMEGVIPNPLIFQSGNDIITGGFAAYQWYLDGVALSGEDNQSMTPTENGSYMVETTNADGCVGLSQPFEVDWVSVIENALIAFNFYPNPADQYIFFSQVNTPEMITVFDQCGKIIMRKTTFTENFLHVGEWQSGFYTMSVVIGKSVVNKSFVVTH